MSKIISFFLLILLIYSAFRLAYHDRVLPGVIFAQDNISYYNRQAAVGLVENKISQFRAKPQIVTIKNTTIELSPQELGITFSSEGTVARLFDQGRSKFPFWNFLSPLAGIFNNTHVEPVYSVDYSQLSNALSKAFSSFERQTKDASIVYEAGKFSIEEGQNGSLVNRSEFIKVLRERIENLSQESIAASFVDEEPFIKSEQAKAALNRISLLNQQKITLKFDRDAWSLGGRSLVDILKFYPKGFEGEHLFVVSLLKSPVSVRRVLYEDSTKPDLDISIDGQKLDAFVENIAKSIDRPTVDATLEFKDGRVSKFIAARDGKKLDLAQTKQFVLDKVSVDNTNFEKEIVINLPVSVTVARFASEEVNTLGIRELIGKGVSYFSGSIANRIFNIGLGAQRISGTIVKPGETFSFNQTVGEVSGATGYKQAYVISKGRTVLDDGGGICQVSSTVFRAALESGLPVVERTAHAYRVAYYEQGGFKPGLDATVWSPAVDFKFKNDTEKHILVQAIFDPVSSKLEVDIYGTRDGRRVEMSSPVVTNVKPAPAALYQDDPTLPKGTTKQVDFAASGATSVFSRKVYKGDKLLADDTFKSNFRPWQAIFLVGTGG